MRYRPLGPEEERPCPRGADVAGLEDAEGAGRDGVACGRGAGDAAGREIERVGARETVGVGVRSVGLMVGVGTLRVGAGVGLWMTGADALRVGARVGARKVGAGVLRVGAGVGVRYVRVGVPRAGEGVTRGTEKVGIGVVRVTGAGVGELGARYCRCCSMRARNSLAREADLGCSGRAGVNKLGVVNGCGLVLAGDRVKVSREGDTGRDWGISIVRVAGRVIVGRGLESVLAGTVAVKRGELWWTLPTLLLVVAPVRRSDSRRLTGRDTASRLGVMVAGSELERIVVGAADRAAGRSGLLGADCLGLDRTLAVAALARGDGRSGALCGAGVSAEVVPALRLSGLARSAESAGSVVAAGNCGR